jgi:hypothetical protein
VLAAGDEGAADVGAEDVGAEDGAAVGVSTESGSPPEQPAVINQAEQTRIPNRRIAEPYPNPRGWCVNRRQQVLEWQG